MVSSLLTPASISRGATDRNVDPSTRPLRQASKITSGIWWAESKSPSLGAATASVSTGPNSPERRGFSEVQSA